jgi:cell division septation protein DedD
MLVFSGVFFSLGYVMGRNQYDGRVNAENNNAVSRLEPTPSARPELAPKKTPAAPAESADSDPATAPGSDSPWKFEENSKAAAKSEPRLEPVPKAPPAPPPAKPVNAKSAPVTAPAAHTNTGAYVLQVAALAKQDDALALAGSLQKKHFAAYVQTPQKDKFYRVQVGPFKDQKNADAAKKGLESAGFKAFYVKR